MMKQILTLLILILTLAACGGTGGNTNNQNSRENRASAAASGDTILMNTTDFATDSVTIPVGTTIALKAEGFVPHFIANGMWQNGKPVDAIEPGAPEVNNIEIKGGDTGMIGPFTESGTFQFYCTIHPNMNLTVTVK